MLWVCLCVFKCGRGWVGGSGLCGKEKKIEYLSVYLYVCLLCVSVYMCVRVYSRCFNVCMRL